MAKYFVKRKNSKRIFEEGEALATPQQVQAAQPAPATGTPAPQSQAPAPAAQPANNATSPANAPAPTAQGNNNNQQAQPQQPAQPSEKETKVTECINQINATVQKNDPYVLLALNIPDLIKQSLPDFANAPDAKDTMGKWEAFKKAPSAETFKNFTDAFVAFGKSGQEAQPQQQSQQNPPQQPQAPAQDAVTQQAESEYRAFTFSQRLNEKLQDKLKISNAAKSFKNYTPFDF